MHIANTHIMQDTVPISVAVIGIGGTGSQILPQLAKLNYSLIKLGFHGINVSAYDNDEVSDSNIGRQLFSPCDIGRNKAVTLIERINRFYGFNWSALPYKFDPNINSSNIIITCVDNVETRLSIDKMQYNNRDIPFEYIPLYWMDFGNSKTNGQVVLGTMNNILRSKLHNNKLKTIIERFPNLLEISKEDNTPSCSLEEALYQQDLFINSALIPFGMHILWSLLKKHQISNCGCYISLDELKVLPIKC